MIPTFTRRFSSTPRVWLDGIRNPYKAKRQWPPDFEKLSQKHQFQLERRYRRRTTLKWARPGWVKFTKLAQWGTISFVVAYSALFLNWGGNGAVFDKVRERYSGLSKNIWSRQPNDATDGPSPKSPAGGS